MADKTIILNQEDVNNPLHSHLWDNFLETLGVDPDATEVCLDLSPLDENKKTEQRKHMPFCWKCANKMVKPHDDGAKGYSLIGCTACTDIHNYRDAEKMCPVMPQNRKSE